MLDVIKVQGTLQENVEQSCNQAITLKKKQKENTVENRRRGAVLDLSTNNYRKNNLMFTGDILDDQKLQQSTIVETISAIIGKYLINKYVFLLENDLIAH